MRFTYLFFLLNILIFFSCKHEKQLLLKVEATKIEITDSLKNNTEIEAFIKPYRDHINKDLDSVLAYSIDTYSKSDGKLNTALGNFMTDAIYEEVDPVFNKQTGNHIDAVILNHGGIRSILPKGPVSARNAFQIMPFENEIVVVGLKGDRIQSIIDYLIERKRAHPIRGLQLTLDKDFNLISAKINNEKIDKNKTYYFATSDYLYNTGDNMTFFQPNESFHIINYKIRNVLIDHFKKVDTIRPVRDDRFIRRN